jgi:enoyl-CoA hydratase
VRGGAVGAGLNLMLATDIRVVARDAKIISGFMPIGLHPGGGHGALLGRTGTREAAAAMALFGERIDGERAAQLGLAWTAVDDDDVEATAIDLAGRAGADPELARRTTASLRTVLGPPALPWPAALELERASQMWSLRRKALDR